MEKVIDMYAQNDDGDPKKNVETLRKGQVWNMCFWVAGVRMMILDLNLWLCLEGGWKFRYTAQEREFVLLLILSTMLWHINCLLNEYFPDMVIT